MKFKVNRDHFASGLQKVQNIVGTRSTMPILGNVLLKAEGDKLFLTTTNLDIGIRCTIKAEVIEAGGITLPVRKLSTIIKSLPNIEVEIETTSSNQAKITSGGSRFRIMGIGQEEFPPLPAISSERDFSLPQADLTSMLRSVSYAQSTDENRYILNGIYFNFKEGELSLVATDGRRLGLISKKVEIKKGNEGKLILPAKTAGEIERLLGNKDSVKITFSERQVAFEITVGEEQQENGLVDNIYLISKVVEGNYPNYTQVIPKETCHRVKLDRELFLECLSRASLVTTEKSNSIKLRLSENLLEISGMSAELGESHESMAIEYANDPVELAFNPQFLMDPLRAVPKDEVFFEFKDELSPGLFKTMENFLCVIMPLRSN